VETELPLFVCSDVAGIADIIEKECFPKRSRSEVRLWIDGGFITLNPFVKAFIGQTVKGMLNALKGCKNPEKIYIKIGR
jgi:hypothetical protein